ncbi:hypothetical protein GLAREA_09740 [Glarea lozoyensis ATCC 20868]|uniref:BTB domain-containing protein n=1 Tax=Glarea lozoyensis (strain ATCC 20868 / MF5171) TaxID=1116229 RepID=S3CUD0_GLAL2|nr:uncharacterized protein GLAREA_09740 [Glarea lozoyensis ATCC 20868]EPE28619.1 hypothetical protein GLAREA_09740 [Glarea lozoyensis ATCC 20868]
MAPETQIYDPDGDVTLVFDKEPHDILAGPKRKFDSNFVSTDAGEVSTEKEERQEREEIRMLVSSKHLALSSPVFRALLTGGLKEGEVLRSEGFVTFPLPEDDVHAFSLIMNIIHARNNSLPNEVSLSTLTSVAILVDKYRFYESVTPWARLWITKYDLKRPATVCKELTGWLCISWVFGLPDEFARATATAALHITSTGIYGTPRGKELSEALPIPASINTKLEETRQNAIKYVMVNLNSIQKRLATDTTLCTIGESNCVALMLGTMERSATVRGLWPFSESYIHSFNTLAHQVRMLDIRSLCGLQSKQEPSPDTSAAASNGSFGGSSSFYQTNSQNPRFPLSSSSSQSSPFLFSQSNSSSQSSPFSFSQNSSSSQSTLFSQNQPPQGRFGTPQRPQAPASKGHDIAGTVAEMIADVERWPVFAKGLDLKDFAVQQ